MFFFFYLQSLERNMSLSGQYLEELSRRYKKQVEELQQSFSKTLLIVEEQSKRNQEREQQLYEQNQKLREDLDKLTDKIFSWKNILIYVTAFACIQIVVIWIILRMWSQRMYTSSNDDDVAAKGLRKNHVANQKNVIRIRRKSIDGSTSQIGKLTKKHRRPSEEALHIAGTYEDLLIDDNGHGNANVDTEEYDNFAEVGRRKGKSRKQIKRATSMEPTVGVRKKMIARQESAPGEFEKLKQKYIAISGGNMMEQPTVLDEDYETYVPGTDLMYNEFMPGGPSGQSTPISGADDGGGLENTSNSSLNSTSKKIGKSRRLSSPAFLKSPFSRSVSNKKKAPHEMATGWEWYRLKRTSTETTTNSSQIKNTKKSKSESPPEVGRTEVIAAAATAANGNASKINGRSIDSIKTTSTTASNTSDKKQGSFRRILKKVF